MKKILSLALAAIMTMSVLPVAYAAENEADYTAGTQITYMGTQEEAAGGVGDIWTVTVPAKMTLGDTGTVKAEGMWSSNKVLAVTNPSSVDLTYGTQTFFAEITGGGMILPGSNIAAVSNEETIKVKSRMYDNNEEYVDVLFGTWTGVLNYTVALVEATNVKGDANGDGIINQADVTYIMEVAGQKITLTDEEKTAALARADMNNDGYLTAIDSSHIMQILSGKISIT